MGPISQSGTEFIADLGRRTMRLTDDLRESRLLSLAIQRFNPVVFSHCIF